MADQSNVGLIVSITTIGGSIVGFLTFWSKLTDKIAEAKSEAKAALTKAEDALQDAAEAKNESENMRAMLIEMIHNMEDRIERAMKADGEGLAAIRQHTQNIELYMRDNFVRTGDFKSAIEDLKEVQSKQDAKLDKILDKIRN